MIVDTLSDNFARGQKEEAWHFLFLKMYPTVAIIIKNSRHFSFCMSLWCRLFMKQSNIILSIFWFVFIGLRTRLPWLLWWQDPRTSTSRLGLHQQEYDSDDVYQPLSRPGLSLRRVGVWWGVLLWGRGIELLPLRTVLGFGLPASMYRVFEWEMRRDRPNSSLYKWVIYHSILSTSFSTYTY